MRCAADEAQSLGFLPDVIGLTLRNPANHNVLPLGRAGATTSIRPSDACQATELFRTKVTLWYLNFNRHVAGLLLLADRGARPFIIGSLFSRGNHRCLHIKGWRGGFFIVQEEERIGLEVL